MFPAVAAAAAGGIHQVTDSINYGESAGEKKNEKEKTIARATNLVDSLVPLWMDKNRMEKTICLIRPECYSKMGCCLISSGPSSRGPIRCCCK